MNIDKELRLSTGVYVLLIGLTAASLSASAYGHGSRAFAITLALGIAWAKAGLIGYHFMRLKEERALVWVILLIAILATLILAVGILPDLALYYR